jgi:ADP-heptose:LPS heptosyltransferase
LSDIIYAPAKTQFGDTIIGIQNAFQYSKENKEKIKFSVNKKITNWEYDKKQFALSTFNECLSIFNYEKYLEITSEANTTSFHKLPKCDEYSECKYKNVTQDKCICYHFDARSRKRKKCPSETERKNIIDYLSNFRDYELYNCSGKTITEVCQKMSTSTLFVGVCSGFSHLAHSVGIETYLLYYGNKKLDNWHRNQKYTKCNGIIELKEKLSL